MNAIDTNVLVYSFLSHWDSLLIAACIETNVDTLYSEDLGDGEQYDTVRVVNPFSGLKENSMVPLTDQAQLRIGQIATGGIVPRCLKNKGVATFPACIDNEMYSNVQYSCGGWKRR